MVDCVAVQPTWILPMTSSPVNLQPSNSLRPRPPSTSHNRCAALADDDDATDLVAPRPDEPRDPSTHPSQPRPPQAPVSTRSTSPPPLVSTNVLSIAHHASPFNTTTPGLSLSQPEAPT